MSVITAFKPELSCLESWDVEPHFLCRFGEKYLGLLLRGLKGIICGDDDGIRYVRIGVPLDRVIVERRSLRGVFTIILVGRVLPIFIYLAYCVLLLDLKSTS